MEPVIVGGVLVQCWRCWNHDTAAALNFQYILQSLREYGEIPERSRRGQPHPQATAVAGDPAAGAQPAAQGRRLRK
ncbi:hypothetical protein H4R19_003235 [Coemansia spiralis]|nr:hypothetical protein H4R19_003235 [Coemansia spiralis]